MALRVCATAALVQKAVPSLFSRANRGRDGNGSGIFYGKLYLRHHVGLSVSSMPVGTRRASKFSLSYGGM
jgi:hypothetical protein